MYRAILVPIDGSSLGERALPPATALARATGARLALVRAAWAQSVPGGDLAEAQVRAVEEAEAYLKGVAGRLREQGVTADVAVPYDHPASGILTEIGLRHADLVVMSTHGRSGLGRWVYGSVAEAVLTRSPVPVLLVRGVGADVPLVPASGHARLLVPLDGSAFAEAALAQAVDLAQGLDATLVLLRALTSAPARVVEPGFIGPVVDPGIDDQEGIDAEAYLNAVAARIKEQGGRVQAVVRAGPAADAILEESRTAGVALVVMATHGRTGLGRLVFGSVALEVLHRGALPVLLVRPVGLTDDQAAPAATTGAAS